MYLCSKDNYMCLAYNKIIIVSLINFLKDSIYGTPEQYIHGGGRGIQ